MMPSSLVRSNFAKGRGGQRAYDRAFAKTANGRKRGLVRGFRKTFHLIAMKAHRAQKRAIGNKGRRARAGNGSTVADIKMATAWMLSQRRRAGSWPTLSAALAHTLGPLCCRTFLKIKKENA